MEPASLETVSQPSPSPTCDGANPATPERSSVVPPYWQRHERHASYISTYSTENERPTPIGLEDHTDEGSEHCKVLWAKGVTIDDFVVVSGTAPGLGAYVVWNCTVETLDGGPMKIRKRYSEFEELRVKLVQTFPQAVGSMPQFPPKSVISRFRPRFLERRKHGLSYFLNCILLNPEFAGSPVLKEFLFS
ncbi:PX-domain-containing protein [Clathrospora elynae]|uniref:Endosomal/vacuolar adapter protein YPT35 n=1 Tax=Clathrospora elynae TaxID=706981 RepID=A0A6A5S9Z1_9PLEO|nr:PX-domain-containing protein [Clathrospora elynae]